MIILTKYHKIHETQADVAVTETFVDYDSALKKMYQYMNANVADTTVETCNIVLMNEEFCIIKVEKYKRNYEEQVTE